MKKYVSLAMAAIMAASAVPAAFATNVDYTIGTAVTVIGKGGEYFVTVPAALQPGQEGTVEVRGKLPSHEKLIVTAASTVEVVNKETQEKTSVGVYFDGLERAGSDLGDIAAEASIRIDGGNISWGEWSGNIEYNVEVGSTSLFAAQIGNQKFNSLQDAINEGGTITLLSDVSESVVISKDVTINLNGNDIISSGDTFEVQSGGKLIINGNGSIVGGKDGTGSWTAIWANGGTVVINGGTFSVGGDSSTDDITHQNDVIYTKNGGSVVINGGHFKNNGTVWTLNENDSNRGTIVVKGGTFENWDPANNVAEGAGTNFVADGYESVKEGNNYVVREKAVSIVSYSYNGLERPALPNRDTTKYPYALIYDNGNKLYFSSIPQVYKAETEEYFEIMMYEYKDGEWVLGFETAMMGAILGGNNPVWGDHDVYNKDGELLFAASAPTPIYG